MRPPLPRPTTYDIEQEQQRHDDAVHWFGELNAFLLWWNVQDFESDLVGRCPTCYTAYGETADAYGQSAQNKCVECFGTTFEGGLRAIYYRPAIWDTSDTDMDIKKRGFIDSTQGTIQVVQNIPLRKGDTVVRVDGTRWDIAVPEAQEITTGFGSQGGLSSRQMRTRVRVMREDPTSQVYLPYIDLASLELQGWLAYVPHSPHPNDDIAPAPVVAPAADTPGELRIQRGRQFSITLEFFADTTQSTPLNVSGDTYVSEFRVGASALSAVVETLSVDMSQAAAGKVTFSLSTALTTGIAEAVVYWDAYRVEGAENVSIIAPYLVEVVD